MRRKKRGERKKRTGKKREIEADLEALPARAVYSALTALRAHLAFGAHRRAAISDSHTAGPDAVTSFEELSNISRHLTDVIAHGYSTLRVSRRLYLIPVIPFGHLIASVSVTTSM